MPLHTSPRRTSEYAEALPGSELQFSFEQVIKTADQNMEVVRTETSYIPRDHVLGSVPIRLSAVTTWHAGTWNHDIYLGRSDGQG